MSNTRLRIGFIPLADATALLIAVDKGFAAEEGLDVELVREVSWSNVRDKLNIGLFDAAHAPAADALFREHQPDPGATAEPVAAAVSKRDFLSGRFSGTHDGDRG